MNVSSTPIGYEPRASNLMHILLKRKEIIPSSDITLEMQKGKMPFWTIRARFSILNLFSTQTELMRQATVPQRLAYWPHEYFQYEFFFIEVTAKNATGKHKHTQNAHILLTHLEMTIYGFL